MLDFWNDINLRSPLYHMGTKGCKKRIQIVPWVIRLHTDITRQTELSWKNLFMIQFILDQCVPTNPNQHLKVNNHIYLPSWMNNYKYLLLHLLHEIINIVYNLSVIQHCMTTLMCSWWGENQGIEHNYCNITLPK